MTTDALLHENIFPGNTVAFNDLKSFMEKGAIVGFTGAGVSVPICPTWTGLLSDLLIQANKKGLISDPTVLKDCEKLISTQPLDLAEFLEDTFGKKPFRSRLTDIFRNSAGAFTDCHKFISELKLRGIVTLNYDNGHEIAFSKKGIHASSGRASDSTLARWIDGSIFEDLNPPILHLHGDVSDPESMVITGDDYDRFYSSMLHESAIQHLWRSNRLLVLGFGFSDPFLTRAAEKVLRNFESDNLHFALIGKRANEPVSFLERRLFTKKYRLSPIFYEIHLTTSHDGSIVEDHSALASLISALPKPSQQPDIQVLTDGKSPVAIITKQVIAPLASNTPTDAQREFERDLFVLPNKGLLYVEPRLSVHAAIGVAGVLSETTIGIKDIISDSESCIITSRPEYGATTLARRLVVEFGLAGMAAVIRDATILPNYKKKLEEHFAAAGFQGDSDATLILDGVDFTRDERLIKEIIGTKIFKRLIIFVKINLFEFGNSLPADQFAVPFKIYTLSNFNRMDIRTFASQFFETSDTDSLSTIVEQVYRDLVALCIPITPANIIMYLTILYREGEFHPINRVQIVGRYLADMLRRPSDALSGKFNARDKMNVISEFVFGLVKAKKSLFNEADWYLFCRDFMKNKLSHFDERALLIELLTTRIVVRIGSHIAFKYSFFYIYFLGHFLSKNPILLAEYISGGAYLQYEGLTEVIAELAPDNTPLFDDIILKLSQALDEFNKRYIPETFDPFAKIQWPSDAKEEEKLWQPLSNALASGPRNPTEIDQIKRSISGENRSNNQLVVVQDFDRLERRLIRLQTALVEALHNSDSLDGETKKNAVLCALKAYFRYYQVAMLLAPIISEKSFFSWHGMLYLLEDFSSVDKLDDKSKKIARTMGAFRNGILIKAAEEIGSTKLGEVFKLLAKDSDFAGLMSLLNFACLVRAKPNDWLPAAQHTIANTDYKSFSLRSMLDISFGQFSDEVNTGNEREQLKRLIATIRLKRDKRKDHPGTKDVEKVVNRLEKLEYFEKATGKIENDPLAQADTTIDIRDIAEAASQLPSD